MSDWDDDVLRLEAELCGALTRVAELEELNENLKRWQDIARPQLEAKVAELEKREAFQNRRWSEVHEALKCPGDKNLAEWAKGHTSKVAELEHSLSDAMEQIAAIQGTNAVHMAKVTELEDKLTRVAAQNTSYYVELLSRCNIITEMEAKIGRLTESKEGGA